MRRQYVNLMGKTEVTDLRKMSIVEHMTLYQTHLDSSGGGTEDLLI